MAHIIIGSLAALLIFNTVIGIGRWVAYKLEIRRINKLIKRNQSNAKG